MALSFVALVARRAYLAQQGGIPCSVVLRVSLKQLGRIALFSAAGAALFAWM